MSQKNELPDPIGLLRMVLDGRISGRISEWPQLKPAVAAVLDRLYELRRALAAIRVVGQIDGYDVIRRESVLEIADDRRATITRAEPDAGATKQHATHCQNGSADVCRAAQRDGVVCPDESCDIDDGIRHRDATAQADGGLGDWVMVPREPTPEMKAAAEECWERWQNGHVVDEMWPAMLAAATQPQQAPAQVQPLCGCGKPAEYEATLGGWSCNKYARCTSPARGDGEGLHAAASAMVRRLDEVHADLRYMGVWATAQLHIGPYVGPQYAAELSALRAALASRPSPTGEVCRWFASGPEGSFFAQEYVHAENLIDVAGFDRDEWTITDLATKPQEADRHG